MANKQKKITGDLKGEYELLSNSSPSRNEARRKFLRAIRIYVLPSLREQVFSIYQTSFEFLAKCLRSSNSVKADNKNELYPLWSEFSNLAQENAELSALYQGIIGWARSHNLLYQEAEKHAVWLLDQTLCTLNHWYLYSGVKENLEWEYTSLSTMPQAQTKENPPFEFKHPAWDCYQISRSDYENGINRVFKLCLKEYLDSRDIGLQKDIAREIGLIKPKKKREGGKKREWSKDHLDWFVRFQVKGVEYPDIPALYATGNKTSDKPTPQAVWSAIRNVGQLIGLEPRPAESNRGRPRKKISVADD